MNVHRPHLALLLSIGLGWLLIAPPGVAAGNCNDGVGGIVVCYDNAYTDAGVKSLQDFESATISSGQGITHPMQIITQGVYGQFVGWGTARGLGTNDPNAVSNCPDDYTAHWKVYIDGVNAIGKYFCRQQYGEVSGTATDQLFTLRYGDCDGTNKWRAFLNGSRLTCQDIGVATAYAVAVAAEIAGNEHDLHVDIHYANLQRYYAPADAWYAWNYYGVTLADAEAPDYSLTILDADDVWMEQTP